MKCPECGADAIRTTMPESGVDYPVWSCTQNMYHWGAL